MHLRFSINNDRRKRNPTGVAHKVEEELAYGQQTTVIAWLNPRIVQLAWSILALG